MGGLFLIKVEHLSKKYGPILAVDDISFEIEAGKIYGFLGPNGAGKSTTMNIMTGYFAATSGKVTIAGYDIVEQPEKAKSHIGYLPEIPPVYTEMTPVEYLDFVYQLKKLPKRDKWSHIEEVVELTGLSEMKHRIIGQLSKGYRQRVGLAQAILGYPDVIILDEPTVGLDPLQIIEIRDLIKSLREKHTVILSSHILSEVSAVCDIILIINKGKLVAIDTPENLSRRVKHGDVLTLKCRGGAQRVRDALGELVGKLSAEISEEVDGVVTVTAQCTEEKDQEDLSFALSDARIAIISMSTAKATLEDVFLELTGDAEIPETVNEEEEAAE